MFPVRYELNLYILKKKCGVRFEVFTAVIMKNGVLWDVTPCGSCKNRRAKTLHIIVTYSKGVNKSTI
jgi:hypothetical protein